MTSNLINILLYNIEALDLSFDRLLMMMMMNIHSKYAALGIKFLCSCKVCCESLKVIEKV